MEEGLIETRHICADCGKDVPVVEEVYLIQVLYQQVTPEGEGFFYVEENNVFTYSPHYFCVKCWETTKESMQSSLEDVPPLNKHGATRECDLCKSGIENMETTAVITIGELRRSEREPGGEPTVHFEGIQRPEVWCMSCAALLNSDLIELWEEGLEDYIDERDEVMYQQLQEADARCE